MRNIVMVLCTSLQALDALRSLVSCDALRLDMWLEPGDLQLLNNHVTLHTRTAFTDFEVRPGDPSMQRPNSDWLAKYLSYFYID